MHTKPRWDYKNKSLFHNHDAELICYKVTMREVVMIIFDKIKNKLGLFKITVIELVASFVIGILIAYCSKTANGSSDYMGTLLSLDLAQLDKVQLLIFVMQYRLKEYLLLWLFSITILAIPYNNIYVIYKGFTTGFVFGALSYLYGWKGFVSGLSLGLPHYIVYIIVLLNTVLISYQLHEKSCSGVYSKKSRLYLKQLPSFLVLLSLTIIGCFMETFLNPALVGWVKELLHMKI